MAVLTLIATWRERLDLYKKAFITSLDTEAALPLAMKMETLAQCLDELVLLERGDLPHD